MLMLKSPYFRDLFIVRVKKLLVSWISIIESVLDDICCATDAWRYDSSQSWELPRNYLRGRSCWMFITTGSSHFIKLTFSYFNLDTTYGDLLKVKLLLIWWKRECRRRKCLRGKQCKVLFKTLKIVDLKTFSGFCTEQSSVGFVSTSWSLVLDKWILPHRTYCKYVMCFPDASPQHINFSGGCLCLTLNYSKQALSV